MKTQTSKTKSLKIFLIVLLLSLFIVPEISFAQPPKWAPAHGYRAKTRYIYFPQHNFYYDIHAHHYFYLNGRNWSVSVAVPAPFISINLGRATQIQLDYYGAYPYYYNRDHCTRYKVVKRQHVVYAKEKYGNDNNHGNKHNGHGKKHGKGHGKKH